MSDRTIEVAFPAARDIALWEERFALGEVPSRWPYGLDGLGTAGVTLRHRPIAPPERSDVVRRMLARALPATDPGLVQLAWDENTANQLSLLRQRGRRFAGVIWLTDRVARNGLDEYRRSIRRLAAFDGLWVLSRAQVEPLQRLLGSDAPPVRFVRFGVDERFFAPAPPPAHPMVLSAGGDRDRDSETMFRALAIVHEAVPSARLVVQTASTAVPPAGVEVIPHLPHRRLAALYAAASVVTVATRPNLHVSGMTVSLEAMATGRPVVVTGSPGFEDYVRDGVDGLVVPQRDPHALAGRIIELLTDRERADRMGRAGRQAVETGLTTRHLAEALSNFIGPAS